MFEEFIDSVEKSSSSKDFYLETTVRKETHKWKETEVRSESKAATGWSWYDCSEYSAHHPDTCFFMEMVLITESVSAIEKSQEKKGKTKNHNTRKKYIDIGMERTVVSFHDFYISKLPPNPGGNPDKDDIEGYSFPGRKKCFQRGDHDKF
jgi:hypothetical protein